MTPPACRRRRPCAQRPSPLPILLVAALLAGGLRADAPVPHRIGVRMLLKALSYDRKLVERCGDAVRVGVLVRAGEATSERDGELLTDALLQVRDSPATAAFVARATQGLPLEVVQIAASSGQDARRSVVQSRAGVVYLGEGWQPEDVRALTDLARELGLLLVASRRELVEAGAAMAVLAVDGRPRFVVNVRAAMAQGADFDGGMLRLSDLIR